MKTTFFLPSVAFLLRCFVSQLNSSVYKMIRDVKTYRQAQSKRGFFAHIAATTSVFAQGVTLSNKNK
jgi:hypothetical protein